MAEMRALNSEYKNIKIAFQHNDAEMAEEYEALSESDPVLQRVDIFNTQSIAKTAEGCRNHQIDLAMICQDEEFDSFYLSLLDLLNSRPSLKLMVLLKEITFDAASRLKSNPGIIDIKSISKVKTYDTFRELAAGFIRSANACSSKEADLDKAESIQKALLIGHDDWLEKKNYSTNLLIKMLDKFDFSTRESQILVVAEKMFLPWLEFINFSTLTQGFDADVEKYLNNSGTWSGVVRSPKTTEGFAITFSNYIAHQMISGKTTEEICSILTDRPNFLKHPSIRVFSKKDLINLVGINQNRMEEIA